MVNVNVYMYVGTSLTTAINSTRRPPTRSTTLLGVAVGP